MHELWETTEDSESEDVWVLHEPCALIRAKSFHEKAGSCQVDLVVAFVRRVVLFGAFPPLPPSFHPHSLWSDFSLGASWASSIQRVLLPVNRPRLPSFRQKSDQDLGAVTRTRRLSSVLGNQP